MGDPHSYQTPWIPQANVAHKSHPETPGASGKATGSSRLLSVKASSLPTGPQWSDSDEIRPRGGGFQTPESSQDSAYPEFVPPEPSPPEAEPGWKGRTQWSRRRALSQTGSLAHWCVREVSEFTNVTSRFIARAIRPSEVRSSRQPPIALPAGFRGEIADENPAEDRFGGHCRKARRSSPARHGRSRWDPCGTLLMFLPSQSTMRRSMSSNGIEGGQPSGPRSSSSRSRRSMSCGRTTSMMAGVWRWFSTMATAPITRQGYDRPGDPPPATRFHGHSDWRRRWSEAAPTLLPRPMASFLRMPLPISPAKSV